MNEKYLEGIIDVVKIKKPKTIFIKEIILKKVNEENLLKILLKIIKKYPKEIIIMDEFNELDKNYELYMDALPKLGFKDILNKQIFKKKVTKAKNINKNITLKPLTDPKIKVEDFYKIYKKATLNNVIAYNYVDSICPRKSFNDYVINKEQEDWNFLVKIKKKTIGYVCLNKIKYRGEYGTLNHIAILPEHQGKGHTKHILSLIEEFFYKKNIKEWRESTAINNDAMNYAFINYGFKKTKMMYGFVFNPNKRLKELYSKTVFQTHK